MSNQIAPKSWWCPECKEFPDEILEVYKSVVECRKWDGIDSYELFDSCFGDVTETLCGKCKTNLESKLEE